MRHHYDTPGTSPGFELSKKTPVRTNLGVLIAIVGAAFLGALAWGHVEFKLLDHQKTIDSVSAIQSVDHDILIRLDQRTQWLGTPRTSATPKPSVAVKAED